VQLETFRRLQGNRSQLAFDADGPGQLHVPTNGLFGAGPMGGNAKSMD
jgi:hypothetical protein